MSDLHIDPQTARAHVDAGAVLVDVRSPEEVASDGGLPGAVHVPLQQFPQQIFDAIAKDKPVVLYCLSGGRSGYAASWLRENGVPEAYNAGGIGQLWHAFKG